MNFGAFGDENGTGIAVDDRFVYLTAGARLYIGRYTDVGDSARIPPVVNITSPSAGAEVVRSLAIPISVNATDDVGIAAVQLLMNGKIVATDIQSPYQFSYLVTDPDGPLRVGAVAIDTGGNVTTAQEVTVTVVLPPLIAYGETISGTISPASEVDIYRFAANAGDSVVMPIVQTSGSAYFNPTVRLYDSAGALVTTKGVDYYGELVQVIAQAGTYYLWVYDDDYYQGGDYNFTLQKVNPPVNAVEVVYGEIKSGTIGVSAEVDIYRFAANAGDSVVMPIVQTSGSAYFNPTVRLYDSAGALVTTKGVDYYGELVQVIAQAGTYYLWVYDDDYYQGGDYNFTLQKVNPPVNAVEVVYGEIKSGTIGVSAEVDIYRFAANAGDSVVMPIVQTSGSAYFNPTVRLYDSAGALVTTKGWTITGSWFR